VKPAKTGPKQARTAQGCFARGHSGNPAGRPQGSRNRATIIAEKCLDRQSEALVNKAITLALEGSEPMLRLLIERLLPPAKERPTDDLHVSSPSLVTVQWVESAQKTEHR
jgi:hypothetical protein